MPAGYGCNIDAMTKPSKGRNAAIVALRHAWEILRDGVACFVEDEALTRGAAIAFYAASALAPVLFITVAIAGLVFGREAASGTVAVRLRDLLSPRAAELVQTAIRNAGHIGNGIIANVVGVGFLLLAASGVFTEIQAALNAIWKVSTKRRWYVSLLASRLVSLGLTIAFGILLMTSMVTTAVINAASEFIEAQIPHGVWILNAANFLLSEFFVTVIFAAIYKFLPDKALSWNDVLVGGAVTAFLFQFGQLLIGLYAGSSWAASLYGVAGGIIALLFWIYYSAEIFLLGAEFTKLYAQRFGSLTWDAHEKAIDESHA